MNDDRYIVRQVQKITIGCKNTTNKWHNMVIAEKIKRRTFVFWKKKICFSFLQSIEKENERAKEIRKTLQ